MNCNRLFMNLDLIRRLTEKDHLTCAVTVIYYMLKGIRIRIICFICIPDTQCLDIKYTRTGLGKVICFPGTHTQMHHESRKELTVLHLTVHTSKRISGRNFTIRISAVCQTVLPTMATCGQNSQGSKYDVYLFHKCIFKSAAKLQTFFRMKKSYGCSKLCGKVWKKVEQNGKLFLFLHPDSVKGKVQQP